MGELSLFAQAVRQHASNTNDSDLTMVAEFFSPTHSRGVIVKAVPNNDRFSDSSVWISLGDGTYRHLSGKKGLIAKFIRLDGYVKPIYDAKNETYFA